MIHLDMPRRWWGQWITVLTCFGLLHMTPGCVVGLNSGDLGGIVGGLTGNSPNAARDVGIFINQSNDSPLLGLARGNGGTLYAYGTRDAAGNPGTLTSLVLETNSAASKSTAMTLHFNDDGLPAKVDLPDSSNYRIQYESTQLVVSITPADGEAQDVVVPLDYYDPQTRTFDRARIHELEAAAESLLGQSVDLDPLVTFIEDAQVFLQTGKNAKQAHFIFNFLRAAVFASVVYVSMTFAVLLAVAAVEAALLGTVAVISAACRTTARLIGGRCVFAAGLAEDAATRGSYSTPNLDDVVVAPPLPLLD